MLNQSVSVENELVQNPKSWFRTETINGHHFRESTEVPKIYKVPPVVLHNITEPVLECVNGKGACM